MEIIQHYFPKLSPEIFTQLGKLQGLYSFWNERINLISRKDMEHFYERHVLHSMALIKWVQFKPGTTVLDVGTGGGFPGIPLAICFPETQFRLVDSIAKKMKVVQDVVENLQLTNVRVSVCRVEQMHESFDFVVSRAVTRLPEFVRLAGNRVARNGFNEISNGILYLKGGDFSEELKELKGWKANISDIGDLFGEEFFSTKKIVHLYR